MATNSGDLALQRGLVRILRADAEIAALVGTVTVNREAIVKVFDEIPHAENGLATVDFPFVSIGECETVPVRMDCGNHEEISVQIDAWSQKPGRAEIKRIVAAIAAALGMANDDAPAIDQDGYHLADLVVERTRILDDPDGRTRHGVILITATMARGV
jgi:hypothetical protein